MTTAPSQSPTRRGWNRAKCTAWLCLFFAPGLGCSDSGPTRHRVQGTVIYRGEPAPAGLVMFDPDVQQGNSGAQGFAMLENGRFDTSAPGGKGVVGGPHVVRVSGYDGQSPSESAPYGKPLFPEYLLQADLPHRASVLNIQVQD